MDRGSPNEVYVDEAGSAGGIAVEQVLAGFMAGEALTGETGFEPITEVSVRTGRAVDPHGVDTLPGAADVMGAGVCVVTFGAVDTFATVFSLDDSDSSSEADERRASGLSISRGRVL